MAATVTVRSQRTAPAPPSPPRQGAITTGVYRNVFVEAGYAQKDIDVRLQATHQQLWEGDPSNGTIVYAAQDATINGSYVTDVANNDVRTERMSYGMMGTVQLNNQTLFDSIFTWYKVYMQHEAGTAASGLSSWHCSTNGRSLSAGSASDGETWFVTALIFATRWWIDSSGRYNYTAETNFIFSALTNKEDPPAVVTAARAASTCSGELWTSTATHERCASCHSWAPSTRTRRITCQRSRGVGEESQWSLSGLVLAISGHHLTHLLAQHHPSSDRSCT